MTILIADDIGREAKDAQGALAYLMRQRKMPDERMLLTDSGAGAVEAFRQTPDISLAVLDIIMESHTAGLKAAGEIQKMKEVPVVLHTGSYAKDLAGLKEWFFAGNGRNTAVSVVPKLGFCESTMTLEGHAETLYAGLQEARVKLGKGNDITFYEKLIAEAHRSPSLGAYDELTVVFKAIRARLNALSSRVQDKELRERLFAIDWHFEDSKDWQSLLHNMRKPHLGYRTHILIYRQRNQNPDLATQGIIAELEKESALLDTIIEKTISAHLRYHPAYPEIREFGKRLQQRERKQFPDGSSTKLIYRQRMLDAERTPYVIIAGDKSPKEYRAEITELLRGGPVIARSAGPEDAKELGMLLAGFFDSFGPLAELGHVYSAVDAIKTMKRPLRIDSPGLKDLVDRREIRELCHVKSLQLPSSSQIQVIIEPYRATEYIGGILQHPNQPHIFIVEYAHRNRSAPTAIHYAFGYNSKDKSILPGSRGNIDFCNLLGARLVELFYQEQEAAKADKTRAGQLEIGFNSNFSVRINNLDNVRAFQYREARPIEEFPTAIGKDYMLVGRTNGEEEMVVVVPSSLEETALICERAAEDRLPVAMVINPGNEAIAHYALFPTDLGLVMTAKGLAIQAHNYLNPSAFARNAVFFRTRDGINELGLSPGQKIRFWSDGMEYGVRVVDRDQEIMKRVKDILNS